MARQTTHAHEAGRRHSCEQQGLQGHGASPEDGLLQGGCSAANYI